MIDGKERKPGSGVVSALLLQEEPGQRPVDPDAFALDEEVIFAVTLVVTQDSNKKLDVSPLNACEVEGIVYHPNTRMLEMTVAVLQNDLQTAKVVCALAEALTSQET